MQCPRCRQDNPSHAKFCLECAYPLVGRVAPAAPEAPPPRLTGTPFITSRSALEGERKQVTVLFADLKGSMEILADRDPEEARGVLDLVLQRMMDAVHRYEGTVNQVMGDGIMALFGAPAAHEDHAVQACYAARHMQEAVRRLAEDLRRREGLDVQIRVGLNSGEVVVRSIGSDLRMDYTAVGQTTHLAARMEQMASPGSILLTDRTLDLAAAHVRVRSLGAQPVKGLDRPVGVHELLGTAPAPVRLRAAPWRELTRFAGRAVELAALRRALDQARAGSGSLVRLVGDPGVGKSRILAELLRSSALGGWSVLEASAASYEKASPFRQATDLLRDYFRIEPSEPAEHVRDVVTARVLSLDAALADAIPPLLSLVESLPEDAPFLTLDPAQRGRRIQEALHGLLLGESARQPVLLIVENLQWVDSETERFLARLAEELPRTRVLFLASHRPEYEPPWMGRADGTVLRLDPLPADEAGVLLRSVLGDDPALEPLARLLIDRTAGNPFFLEESVRALAEAGVLAGQRGAYRLGGRPDAFPIPASVQAVLAARIDRLPPDEKRLLESAAIIGRHVPLALIGVVADLPAEVLHQGLGHLRQAGFLDEASSAGDLQYTFRHGLTLEVAYSALVKEQRRAGHARVVQAIEALYPDRLSAHVERLAQHALRGEVWPRAVSYCRQAGVRAAGRSANEAAVTYFRQALDALARSPAGPEATRDGIGIRLELRASLLQLGRLDEALRVSREAEGMAELLGDERELARVYTYLINYHYLRGEPEAAIEYGERCLRVGQASGDLALQALARQYLGHCYHAQGQYRQAESVLRANVEMIETEAAGGNGPAGIAYVASCGWLAFALADTGDFEAARVYLDKARRVAEADGQPYGQVIAWSLEGLVHIHRGDLEGAREALQRSLDTCEAHRLLLWQPIPSSLLGLVLVRLGRVDEGLLMLERGVALAEELGIKAYLALWKAALGEGLLAAGDLERAQAEAQEALELARTHRERGHEAWALRLLGDIASRMGGSAVSLVQASYGDALVLAGERGMRPLLARAHYELGLLCRRAQDPGKAGEHLAAATVLFHEQGVQQWMARSADEIMSLGRLVVVTRSRPALYEGLRRHQRTGDGAQVFLDRRVRQRRETAAPLAAERRRGDRRCPGENGAALETWGLLVTA